MQEEVNLKTGRKVKFIYLELMDDGRLQLAGNEVVYRRITKARIPLSRGC